MSFYIIRINTNTKAFDSCVGSEVARILVDLAVEIENNNSLGTTILYDINHLSVGKAVGLLTKKPPQRKAERL